MVRVRFAPSPTGYMHVGNARTALFNFLFARNLGGKFILRVEDTDTERHLEEAVRVIYDSLKWMGLDWDEGPDIGGPYGPYRQSERLDIYRRFIKELKEKDLVYECFCSAKELENMRRQQLERGEPPRYTGKCRNLTEEEKERLRKEGRKPALRFKVPDKWIEWTDLVKGKIKIHSSQLGGDFVIVRPNGVPVYNFAVVIDDALMRISHVIRGEDHISNTPKQILLYEALGFEVPEFAHLPMILGQDKKKLSKRHGAVSVSQFKEDGYLPEALVNFLALLGWYPKDGKEVMTLKELISKFDIKDVSRSNAIFNVEKLNWLNREHMKRYSDKELTDLLIPYYKRAGFDVEGIEFEKLVKITSAIRDYLSKLSEAPKYAEVFFKDEFELEPEALDFMKNHEESLSVVESFLQLVEQEEVLDGQVFKKLVKKVQKKLKVRGKKLYMPLRICLTGRMSGVELDKLVEILGKDRVKERLERSLKRMS